MLQQNQSPDNFARQTTILQLQQEKENQILSQDSPEMDWYLFCNRILCWLKNFIQISNLGFVLSNPTEYDGLEGLGFRRKPAVIGLLLTTENVKII